MVADHVFPVAVGARENPYSLRSRGSILHWPDRERCRRLTTERAFDAVVTGQGASIEADLVVRPSQAIGQPKGIERLPLLFTLLQRVEPIGPFRWGRRERVCLAPPGYITAHVVLR